MLTGDSGMSKKDWQDIMIEYKMGSDWFTESMTKETSLLYCFRLCEGIIKLQEELDFTNNVLKQAKKVIRRLRKDRVNYLSKE